MALNKTKLTESTEIVERKVIQTNKEILIGTKNMKVKLRKINFHLKRDFPFKKKILPVKIGCHGNSKGKVNEH